MPEEPLPQVTRQRGDFRPPGLFKSDRDSRRRLLRLCATRVKIGLRNAGTPSGDHSKEGRRDAILNLTRTACRVTAVVKSVLRRTPLHCARGMQRSRRPLLEYAAHILTVYVASQYRCAPQVAVHIPEQALLRTHEQPIEHRLVSMLR